MFELSCPLNLIADSLETLRYSSTDVISEINKNKFIF